VNRKDRDVLRELAKQVAGIAALPVQQQTIGLWKALNGLKPVRPMVTIDQVCWNEMDVDGELALGTTDEFCRDLETRLRRTLYAWKHMRADMVVEPAIRLGKVLTDTSFGLDRVERIAVTDPTSDVVGHFYTDQLSTEADLEKIRTPRVSLDANATGEAEARAREIFDGVLDVRMEGWHPMFAPWDALVQWRGAQPLLLDLVERPDFMHRMVGRLTEAMLSWLDRLEAQGLLCGHQSLIHCTGAWTDELPAPGFDPVPTGRDAKDLWTCGQAQIFSSVSPAMHREFELDYAERWYSRFGLGYYGCCEPLDAKVDLIRKLPHVRKISMSPWVDIEKGAERIGRDFVFSRKPAPALLAVETWNPDAVEKDLRDTVDCCARHGCPVELILKDISTVRYQPQRLWQWADVARRVVGAV
jgi:hypothetical protein